MIHSKLKKLHEFAIDLRRIGMYQTAGDIDYLVSWLVSPEFNNGTHLKPHPAGKNTVDPYSNNCPIPFTANLDLIRKCTSLIEAKYIVGEILKILDYLKSIFTSNVESIAIESYINYSNTLYVILGGEPVSDYTLTFTNTTYPDLPVSLPDPVTVSGGTTVVLPQVDGEYEDGENIYTPSSWSVGDFNDIITINEDITANLLWEVTPIPSGDDPRKPLMFLSLEDGSTVKLETHSSYYNTYEVSSDGENWSSYTFGTNITLNEGDKVYFRCTYFTPSNNGDRYVQFVMSGKLEAYNNVNSMYSTDFANITTLTQQWVFYSLFDSCKSLYRSPILPATTLSTACYASMFSGCSNLAESPALPALTLATNCYAGMFINCKSLTKAPELPATDLATSCYYRMFRFCTHLAEVRCAAVNPPSGESIVGCCYEWLDDASASGTFYADPDATWTSDVNGIPSGWTRISL